MHSRTTQTVAILFSAFISVSTAWANSSKSEPTAPLASTEASCTCLLSNQQDCTAHNVKDVTGVTVQDLGLEFVQPSKDPQTGFVVGGINSSSTIQKLTSINQISIEALESKMRPTENILGDESPDFFLGKQENLLRVLSEDNDFVLNQLRANHQKISKHLRFILAAADKLGQLQVHIDPSSLEVTGTAKIKYHGCLFEVVFGPTYLGSQASPFNDGTSASTEYTIRNLSNGTSIHFSQLLPDLIERYGFYEGHETSYRLDPRAIAEVLPFLAGR